MRQPEAILSELEIFGVRLGLERVEALLDSLSAPHRGLRVVLVAGTNGKGSTSALLASILGASGLEVGLYTSPHLESVEERLRIGGKSIPRLELAELLERVVSEGRALNGEPPTYFESLTAAAFLWFQRRRVDIAVLEVGLGGRLDATNVATPVLSVITSIGLDHQKVLGETLAQIAREKAGILRAGGEAVMWVDAEAARGAIVRRAEELDAVLLDARQLATWGPYSPNQESRRLETAVRFYELSSPLVGAHQFDNLALAVVSAERLASSQGFAVDRRAVEAGVSAARWPGRLETVEAGGRRWVLDGAHNVSAIEALGAALGTPRRGRRLTVFGALADKSVEEMADRAASIGDELLLVPPPSDRAASAEQLLEALPQAPWGLASTVGEAIALIEGSPFEEIVVCGSLYLVGEMRAALRDRFGVPLPAAAISTGP